jgi:hypothetical protein
MTVAFSPAGATFALNVGSDGTTATVTSLVPVRSFYVTNTGNTPVQVDMDPQEFPIAIFPTPGLGNQTFGPVLGSQDDVIINIPNVRANTTQTNGFTYSVNISMITPSGTGTSLVYVTPVVLDNSFTQ